ncbi:MAG: DNA topoisomerase VI subunit B, partial [Thermoguttaceae bacterium]
AVVDVLPAEPVEIKPHPDGIELGRLAQMIHDTPASTMKQFLTESFSKVGGVVARHLCEAAKIDLRYKPAKMQRPDVEALFQAIQDTQIPPPSTDCISPIGEDYLLKGLHQVVPGQFFATATRPPSVYRGNPFQVEVGLAFGGAAASHRVSLETLEELLNESDARTVRQFLTSTFDGLRADFADKIIKSARLRPRVSLKNIDRKEMVRLHESLQSINLSEGQSMNVYRYANRVPLQFQAGACLITQTVMGLNWRIYGLNQARNQLPRGPVTIIVHLASVWVPFTSESKEAIAAYPEIQKELRLGLQSVGRKLGMFLKRKERVKQEGERRSVFLRYLGEVATAVSSVNGGDREKIYNKLIELAKHKTATADVILGEDGKAIVEDETNFGDNVIIVDDV